MLKNQCIYYYADIVNIVCDLFSFSLQVTSCLLRISMSWSSLWRVTTHQQVLV